ncbi:MAG: hypothetical protein ACREQ3_10790, partial [Candidatus Binatia bacterium]
MRLLIALDEQGLIDVQVLTSSEAEQQQAHRLFTAVRAEIEALGAAVRRIATQRAEGQDNAE